MKSIIFLSFFCFLSSVLQANIISSIAYQQEKKFTVTFKDATLKEVITYIEKNSEYVFFYQPDMLKINKRITVQVKDEAIRQLLDKVLANTSLYYEIKERQIVLKKNKHVQEASSPQKQQKRKIQGVVKDEQGVPIIGANVQIKNTGTGTITNLDGQFSVIVSGNDPALVFSYIGYTTQEVKVGNRQSLNVTLEDDTKTLNEVVVVGFGAQKKANLTGAVSSVKMDEVLGDRPILNVSDALQGAVPGMLVSSKNNAPGVSKSFQIRGAYSVGINNGNGGVIAPLILIDNVEGDLDMINPEDIESISVLKDAASAAIYGARAAGGVVLVTTKASKGVTSFKLNYNNNFAIGTAVNLPKQAPLLDYLQAYLDAGYSDSYSSLGSPSVSKWMEYFTEYKKNPAAFDIVGDGIFVDDSGTPYYLKDEDIYKNFMEKSFQMTHNISATGGTEHIRYRISGGYSSNDGVLISDKDKFQRMNINAFISADVTKWFTQEITMSYAHSYRTEPGAGGNIYNLRLNSYYPEGIFPASVNTIAKEDLPLATSRNLILLSNPEKRNTDNPRIFIKSILKPFKGFEAVFEYTFDKNVYDYSWYTGKFDYVKIQGGKMSSFTDDYLQKQKQFTNYNAFNIYGTYSKNFGNHHFKLMAGFNQESSYRENLNVLSYNQAVIEVPAMASGTGAIKATDNYNEYAIRGGFFRLNYTYQDKYLLEVNGRYDGSSKFPKNSRFGFFPSVSAGWQIGQEKFMEFTHNWLDGLKLRASYGIIGNQNISPYTFTPTMNVNNKAKSWIVDNYYVTAISSLPALVSRNFTWEKVGTVDIGIDATLFHNRLDVAFDWYQRDTKDMLAPGMQLPELVGANAPFQNTADMRTRGWELSLNWRDKIGKVGYRVGLNLSDYQSEIVKYNDNESKLLTNFYKGMKLGEIWGRVVDGYYTIDDFEDANSWKVKEGVTTIDGINVRPGDVKYKNLRDDNYTTNVITNGENTFDNPGDRKIIGNETPRYQYGINLGVNYSGFDLNVILQGIGKRDYWLANSTTFPMLGDSFVPLFSGLDDYWRPRDPDNGDWTAINPNAKYPRIYGNLGNSGSNTQKSDKYLQDASYLRIKNITLSYTLPKQWFTKIFINQMKAFVSIENVATFTSLPKGIDPERIKWEYPSFRTVSFGLNFTL